jgi:glycerate 2-kinase
MFAPQRFLTSTLQQRSVLRVLASAFNAVEPGTAVMKYLRENPLPIAKRTFAFGLGKAASAMIRSLADETRLTDSLVITKHASPLTFMPVTVIEGDHPVPGTSSLDAGTAALKFLSQLTPEDLLVCLISGGGSALMTVPYVPLADLQSLTSALLACGARIDEINILRRHLDQLKGGGVARSANGARIVSLILSDVVNDSLEAIASGPTAPDPTTCVDALAILQKYDLLNKIPNILVSSFQESLKPDDPVFARVHNTLIASNNIALLAAQSQAQAEGFQTHILRMALQGEARLVGVETASQLKHSLQTIPRPFCLLAGGETTVTIKGDGRGGRNQELALAAVDVLAGLDNVMLISIGTDGEDGPTDAAGAVVSGQSAQRAESLGISAAVYLSRNDAYSFFDALNDLVRTGPSGTNVNDLILCFAF